MDRHRRAIVLTVVLATLSMAAGPPVALRVETAAVRPEGDATVISVTVQVAPEDRSRLGSDVWVQGELLRRGERVNRTARAVDLNEHGQAAFEVAWPPGDYELRVSVEGVTGKAAGIWVGPLAVPALISAPAQVAPAPAAATAAVESPPTAAATAVEPTVAVPTPQPEVAAPTETIPEPAAEPSPAEKPPVAAAATAAAAAAVVPPSTAAAPPEAQPTKAEPAPHAEAVASTETVSSPPPEPSPAEVEPLAVATTATTAATVPESQPAETEPAPPAEALPEPVVEPPRAEDLSAAPTAAAGSWAAAHPEMADVTVIVTERNRPILGLGPTAFRLRVGGSPVTVDAVGDAASAPLNLAIVADLAPDAGELADEIARQLGRFSLRTRDGGDLLVATAAEPRPRWGAGPDDLLRWADVASTGPTDDLAALVTTAAQSTAGRRGRSFLVIVTDGSDASGKAAWKDAAAAAEAAGAPVFVIGLRDSGFNDQARTGLGRIADSSGGRSYFLGSAGMAGMTLDYLGELLDASYALAFRQPVSGPSPREVKVEVVSRDWQVQFPRQIP